MIVLGVEVSDDIITGLKKRFTRLYRNVMKSVVWWYHKTIFPRHFFNSNRSRYRMEKRSEFYLKVIKPRRGSATGRFVDLILKGTSRRRMQAFATVRATDDGNSVMLRMSAPRHFTNPYVGAYTDDKGEVKHITHQPDKVKEVVQFNDEDRQAMVKEFSQQIQSAFQAAKTRTKRSL